MPWWPPSFDWLLPLRFEIALHLQANKKWIKRAGFNIGDLRQFVAVRPLATGIKQDGENGSGMR